jgi:hypothetical protein
MIKLETPNFVYRTDSPNIIRMIKSWRVGWVAKMARTRVRDMNMQVIAEDTGR